MPSRLRDLIAGAALLAVALVWLVLVFTTIEPGQGVAAGARTFPFFFGLLLAALSLAMLVQAFLKADAADEPEAENETVAPNEATSVVATIAALVVYGTILQPLGFILATTIAVATIMIFLLRIRSPLQIAAIPLSLAASVLVGYGLLLEPLGSILTSAAVSLALPAGYSFLPEALGVVLTTVVVFAGVMTFFVLIRAPLEIAAMSLGLAVVCYVVFGKLLGTPLPAGTLYPIYF